jgi:hypothetical protein
MSYFIGAPEAAASGAQTKGLGGPGEIDLARRTITLRKMPENQRAQAPRPRPGHNPVATKFLPRQDILVMGVSAWMRAQRGQARRPGFYRAQLAPQPKATPQPRRPAPRNRFALLKEMQSLMQPPAPPAGAAPLVTLALKELPFRPETLKRAASMAARIARPVLTPT